MLGVIFSQQRALYGSVGLSILFMVGIFIYVRREWIKNNLNFLGVYASIAVIIIALIFIIFQSATGGKFLPTLYARTFILLNPELLGKDISWAIRFNEVKAALKGFEHFWLFGQGFGASQVTRFRYVAQITVDNSYAYLIWKTGIVGLLSLIYMYFIFFKRGIQTLRKDITIEEKIYLITALLNATGMLLVAFTNASIAHYRLIFVWSALFACVETIARKYD